MAKIATYLVSISAGYSVLGIKVMAFFKENIPRLAPYVYFDNPAIYLKRLWQPLNQMQFTCNFISRKFSVMHVLKLLGCFTCFVWLMQAVLCF